MSAEDVCKAVPLVEEDARILSKGDRPIAELVNELRDKGHTIDATAALLGANRSTVIRARKQRK